jgi:hypothetical protein
MAEKETIITKTYELLKFIIPILAKFPRDQRFLLGAQIQKLISKIMDAFIEACYSKQKLPTLYPVNLKLERLRFRIRLSHDY